MVLLHETLELNPIQIRNGVANATLLTMESYIGGAIMAMAVLGGLILAC